VDESRKIVRDIMRDARDVLGIIDKWETELREEQEKDESNVDTNKRDESEDEQIKKKKKKISMRMFI
jgi:hypothetical protein